MRLRKYTAILFPVAGTAALFTFVQPIDNPTFDVAWAMATTPIAALIGLSVFCNEWLGPRSEADPKGESLIRQVQRTSRAAVAIIGVWSLIAALMS